jgi:hypothetical protein
MAAAQNVDDTLNPVAQSCQHSQRTPHIILYYTCSSVTMVLDFELRDLFLPQDIYYAGFT